MAKRTSGVYDFFHEEDSFFRCVISDKDDKQCDETINKLTSGSTSSNLKRHLFRCHPKEHSLVEAKDQERKKPKLSITLPSASGQQSIKNFFKTSTKKGTVSLEREEFIQGILQMVVYDGVPLTFFQGKF